MHYFYLNYVLNISVMQCRNETKVKHILEKVKESKWEWAGHVARFQDNRWTKKLTEWRPRSGTRKRGRKMAR